MFNFMLKFECPNECIIIKHHTERCIRSLGFSDLSKLNSEEKKALVLKVTDGVNALKLKSFDAEVLCVFNREGFSLWGMKREDIQELEAQLDAELLIAKEGHRGITKTISSSFLNALFKNSQNAKGALKSHIENCVQDLGDVEKALLSVKEKTKVLEKICDGIPATTDRQIAYYHVQDMPDLLCRDHHFNFIGLSAKLVKPLLKGRIYNNVRRGTGIDEMICNFEGHYANSLKLYFDRILEKLDIKDKKGMSERDKIRVFKRLFSTSIHQDEKITKKLSHTFRLRMGWIAYDKLTLHQKTDLLKFMYTKTKHRDRVEFSRVLEDARNYGIRLETSPLLHDRKSERYIRNTNYKGTKLFYVNVAELLNYAFETADAESSFDDVFEDLKKFELLRFVTIDFKRSAKNVFNRAKRNRVQSAEGRGTEDQMVNQFIKLLDSLELKFSANTQAFDLASVLKGIKVTNASAATDERKAAIMTHLMGRYSLRTLREPSVVNELVRLLELREGVLATLPSDQIATICDKYVNEAKTDENPGELSDFLEQLFRCF